MGAVSKNVQDGAAKCCSSGSPEALSTPHQRTNEHSARGAHESCASLVEMFAIDENTASRQKLLLIRKQEYLLLGGDRAGFSAVLAEQDNVMFHNHARQYCGVWAEASQASE